MAHNIPHMYFQPTKYLTQPSLLVSPVQVKVMLRICPVEAQQGSFLSLDARRKQVTVYDPSINGYTTSAHRARGVVAAPKMFAFDTIFSQDDSLVSIFTVLNFFISPLRTSS